MNRARRGAGCGLSGDQIQFARLARRKGGYGATLGRGSAANSGCSGNRNSQCVCWKGQQHNERAVASRLLAQHCATDVQPTRWVRRWGWLVRTNKALKWSPLPPGGRQLAAPLGRSVNQQCRSVALLTGILEPSPATTTRGQSIGSANTNPLSSVPVLVALGSDLKPVCVCLWQPNSAGLEAEQRVAAPSQFSLEMALPLLAILHIGRVQLINSVLLDYPHWLRGLHLEAACCCCFARYSAAC